MRSELFRSSKNSHWAALLEYALDADSQNGISNSHVLAKRSAAAAAPALKCRWYTWGRHRVIGPGKTTPKALKRVQGTATFKSSAEKRDAPSVQSTLYTPDKSRCTAAARSRRCTSRRASARGSVRYAPPARSGISSPPLIAFFLKYRFSFSCAVSRYASQTLRRSSAGQHHPRP